MISSIGGGMPSMPSLQSLQKQAFSKADSSGNGSLDVGEFKNLMAQGPGGKGPPGVQDVDSLFKSADADGNGELSSAELQTGMETAMQGALQSLRGAMGPGSLGGSGDGGSGSSTSSDEQDAWKALLDSLQQADRSNQGQAARRAYAGTPSVGLSVNA